MRAFAGSVALCMSLAVPINAIHAQECPPTCAQLKRMNERQLTQLFENADAGELPTGYVRGHVLLRIDSKLPRLNARLASLAWKGKHFTSDGEFINQFCGFRALRGQVAPGTSCHDGKPCLVTEYPPDTPIFGNTWDELRQIAPGMYLGRLYERCPCPRFCGYFVLIAGCP